MDGQEDGGPEPVSGMGEDQAGERDGTPDRRGQPAGPQSQALAEVEGPGEQPVEDREGQAAHHQDVLGMPEGEHVCDAGEEAGTARAEQGTDEEVHAHARGDVSQCEHPLDGEEDVAEDEVEEAHEIEEEESVELEKGRSCAEVVCPDGDLATGEGLGRDPGIGVVEVGVGDPAGLAGCEVESDEDQAGEGQEEPRAGLGLEDFVEEPGETMLPKLQEQE